MHSPSLSFSIPRVPPRPSSAASNRSTPSIRARSPSLLPDDTGKSIPLSQHPTEFYSSPSLSPPKTVSIRHHMSTLNYSICHQQAQLQNLENLLLQLASRIPMSVSQYFQFSASLASTGPVGSRPNDPKWEGQKVRRHSSFNILHSLAGSDSNLPLPRREPVSLS